jgi:hypothetical protein
VTLDFWVNIVDPTLCMPGIIEFSNPRPTGFVEAVVYVRFYMPTTNPLWARSDAAFVAGSMACVLRVNPQLTQDDLLASHVGRLRHAQPVGPPGCQAWMPAVRTSIAGLQIADTSSYYPEDRGIAESVRLWRVMARRIGAAEGDRA